MFARQEKYEGIDLTKYVDTPPKVEELVGEIRDSRKTRSRLAILLAVKNDTVRLRLFLDNLLNQSFNDYDVIIVYGENDTFLTEYENRLRMVHMRRIFDYGFTGGIYASQRWAHSQDYEFIAFSPMSTRLVSPDAIEKMIKCISDNEKFLYVYTSFLVYFSIYRRNLFSTVGFFYFPFCVGGDDECFLHVSFDLPCKFVGVQLTAERQVTLKRYFNQAAFYGIADLWYYSLVLCSSPPFYMKDICKAMLDTSFKESLIKKTKTLLGKTKTYLQVAYELSKRVVLGTLTTSIFGFKWYLFLVSGKVGRPPRTVLYSIEKINRKNLQKNTLNAEKPYFTRYMLYKLLFWGRAEVVDSDGIWRVKSNSIIMRIIVFFFFPFLFTFLYARMVVFGFTHSIYYIPKEMRQDAAILREQKRCK